MTPSPQSQPQQTFKNRGIQIVYKDEEDRKQTVIIEIPEGDYFDDLSYRENVERAANNIMDEGGFWLDASTIIPCHRILAIKTYIVRQKTFRQGRRTRRPRNNENTVSNADKVSPTSSNPGRKD